MQIDTDISCFPRIVISKSGVRVHFMMGSNEASALISPAKAMELGGFLHQAGIHGGHLANPPPTPKTA